MGNSVWNWIVWSLASVADTALIFFYMRFQSRPLPYHSICLSPHFFWPNHCFSTITSISFLFSFPSSTPQLAVVPRWLCWFIPGLDRSQLLSNSLLSSWHNLAKSQRQSRFCAILLQALTAVEHVSPPIMHFFFPQLSPQWTLLLLPYGNGGMQCIWKEIIWKYSFHRAKQQTLFNYV